MYNSDLPTRAELPTSRQLLRSTFIALATACLLLVTIVLPAEYGIDPTGAGQALGLKQMGDIKTQLYQEAIDDAATDAKKAKPDQRSSLWDAIISEMIIGTAHAQAAPAVRTDETSVTLQPGEGVEVKAALTKGQKITYSWKTDGGKVNHDTHGEPHNNPNATTSYKKDRGVTGDEGVLTAAFDGNHGWFWRNRGSAPVTVTLKTSGDYTEIKRLK
ncbi:MULTISPECIES: transmembrane anchor protein [Rhodomicrobium]|uniref:transmembrane anchor protein n=1 Tax=Rhodomicrobium TaxID=1068 RepID=UPI000B4AE53C|nr:MULTISPECIES: transmembrane anchor protein [Rhodomicrobium]